MNIFQIIFLSAAFLIGLAVFGVVLFILWLRGIARAESDVNGDPERDAGYTEKEIAEMHVRASAANSLPELVCSPTFEAFCPVCRRVKLLGVWKYSTEVHSAQQIVRCESCEALFQAREKLAPFYARKSLNSQPSTH
jgi:hypothetical protein